MEKVRVKISCNSVTKTLHWQDKEKHLYTAEFSVVTSGSEENDKYFEATPSGIVKLATFKEDHFKVGQDYYLDFTEA